jgi:DNA-binding transcriptional LysR family regulator
LGIRADNRLVPFTSYTGRAEPSEGCPFPGAGDAAGCGCDAAGDFFESQTFHKPRVVEEHDGWSGVFSAVSAGTGVALTSDVFDYAFNDRVKLVRLTPEPKRIAIGLITRKGKLSLATEKFCQCAKEAFSGGR